MSSILFLSCPKQSYPLPMKSSQHVLFKGNGESSREASTLDKIELAKKQNQSLFELVDNLTKKNAKLDFEKIIVHLNRFKQGGGKSSNTGRDEHIFVKVLGAFDKESKYSISEQIKMMFDAGLPLHKTDPGIELRQLITYYKKEKNEANKKDLVVGMKLIWGEMYIPIWGSGTVFTSHCKKCALSKNLIDVLTPEVTATPVPLPNLKQK